MSFERFCQPACVFFCCSIYVEIAQNSREECNEFAELLFQRLSLCLSRDSLSCDTRSLDLCILFDSSLYFYTFNTFRPILALFTHFTFQDLLSYVYYHADYDAVSRNLIIIFNFSSKRPHLNYIFLSNVYSFDTMLIYIIYQQSFKPCCYCLIKVKA